MRAFFLVLLLLIAPVQAQALSRNTSTMVTTGWYGILGGTAVGLVAWPLAGSNRAVGIGAAVGLWLGLAVGIYHIHHRDDPGNPLRSDARDKPQLFVDEWEHSPFERQDPVAIRLEVPVATF
jgi:hypothetical protein